MAERSPQFEAHLARLMAHNRITAEALALSMADPSVGSGTGQRALQVALAVALTVIGGLGVAVGGSQESRESLALASTGVLVAAGLSWGAEVISYVMGRRRRAKARARYCAPLGPQHQAHVVALAETVPVIREVLERWRVRDIEVRLAEYSLLVELDRLDRLRHLAAWSRNDRVDASAPLTGKAK